MITVWLKFIICAAIIFFAGSKLTKYGDAIGEKTGLCRAWIGIVLLAAVTSLPELANGISAVVIARVPDLAVGDLLGACMMNVFTLALLDIFMWARKKESIFIKAKESNLLSALFGVLLLLMAALGLALSRSYFDFQILSISIYTIAIFATYFLAQKILFSHSQGEETSGEKNYAHLSNFQTYLGFLILALIVIACGSWLPMIGTEIVKVMGWGQTFVAVLFLALATTLPEMTVSISALRIGQVGMAVGNLIGSNVFNVSLLFIVDAFYRSGSIVAVVSSSMIYAALSAALLLAVVYFAMKKKMTNRVPALAMVILYLISLFFLFCSGVVI